MEEFGICTWKVDVVKDLRIIFYFEFYFIEGCRYNFICSGCIRVELRDDLNELFWRIFCNFKSEIFELILINKSILFVNFIIANDDFDSWFIVDYVIWLFERSMNVNVMWFEIIFGL